MPLKLNLGLYKKIGLPNYGSLGGLGLRRLERLAQKMYDKPLAGLAIT